MKVKVSEAANLQLDWMVAEAKGIEVIYHDDGITRCVMRKGDRGQYAGRFAPTTDWSQGGPIIEREKISTNSDYNGAYADGWVAETYSGGIQQAGSTPLIAAMRCFVVSKLGDEVEIPEELA